MRSKKVLPLIPILCLLCALLSGCKIETPEQAAGWAPVSDLSISVSSPSETSGNVQQESSSQQDSSFSSNPKSSSGPAQPDHSFSSAPKSSNSAYPASSAQEPNPDPGTSKSSASSSKDQSQTQPVPEEKPGPVEPQNQNPEKKIIKYCTLSVDCKTILDNKEDLKKEKLSVLPLDGVIFKETKVIFYEGESVFDVLNREMKKNRIHMEFRSTPMYNSNYIAGIRNLYEFDCGELSGWMYSVNGWYPNYGVSRYLVREGDAIQFRYTCDLGRDIGCDWLAEET